MNPTPVFIGIDLGTTSAKALALGLDGVIVGETAETYPTTRPQPGHAQQDPSDWLTAVRSAATRLLDEHHIEPVSVGFVAQVNTHVLADANLQALTPAITWQDQRCADVAAQLADELGAKRINELWGGPFSIDASFSISRLLWWQQHAPAAVENATHLLAPKDFCIAAITGNLVTDPISPVGLVGADGQYLNDVLALIDGFAQLQPDLAALDAPAGTSNGELGLPAGLPVAVGTMDALGCIIGSGAVDVGDAFEISGTSEVVGLLTGSPTTADGIISLPPINDHHVLVGPTQAGGDALRWVAHTLGLGVREALVLASTAQRSGPPPLLFLPHLAGERAPVWNADARGVWLGLSAQTGPGELVLAVLEGVAFSARRIMDLCRHAVPEQPTSVRLSGGASRSPLWNEIKSTVLDLHGHVVASPSSGAIGAALCGAAAHGAFGPLDTLARELVRIDHIIEPAADARQRLDDLYGQYLNAYDALLPVFSRLAEIG